MMSEDLTYEAMRERLKELEQKFSERDLLAEQLENIFDCSLDLIGSGNLDGYFTRINPSFGHILGYADAEFLAQPFLSFIHKDDVQKTKKALATAVKGKRELHVQNRYRCKDDSYKWIEWRVLVNAKEDQFVAVGRDFSLRKQAEDRFRLAAEASSDLVFEWNILDDTLLWFGDIDGALGYEPGEFPRTIKAWVEHIDPADVERLADAVERHRSSTEPINYDYRVRLKDGTWRYWSDHGVPVVEEGRPVKWVGVCTDITEKRLAERALQASEEKFRKILENLMDVYFETSLDGTIKYTTPSGAALSGFSMDELIGNKADMLYHNPQDREGLLAALGKNGKVRGYELLFQMKDGETYDVSMNADISLGEDGTPEGMTGTIRDITQEKKLKQQFQRSKKMESLGLMAGGIAHDLNNILSGIVSYPELLLMQLPPDSPLRESIETIKDSGQRAAAVVMDLITVAKGVATGKETLNLNAIINEYISSGEIKGLNECHPGVCLEYVLEPELLNISCSSIHIKKILMNLALNACEAIEYHGSVVISTQNRYLDEPLSGYEDIRVGEYVLLTVSDTGAGISQKIIDRIFEPFFTKKVMGRSGTGLGLAVVWNTVQDHDGYINVHSSKKGTTFELYFPVSREEIASDKQKISLEEFIGNGERILVIDDEKTQRDITCGLLVQLGYLPTAVSSGEEALEYLENNRADLLVLDMIMSPGMNGRETFEKIIKKNPEQKAIIASGYAETEDVRGAMKLGVGRFVKKPYTMEKIGIAIRDELRKRRN